MYEEDIGKDDFMGKIAMDINELVYKQKLTDQWIPLSDCKSGEIFVTVETAPKVLLKLRHLICQQNHPLMVRSSLLSLLLRKQKVDEITIGV